MVFRFDPFETYYTLTRFHGYWFKMLNVVEILLVVQASDLQLLIKCTDTNTFTYSQIHIHTHSITATSMMLNFRISNCSLTKHTVTHTETQTHLYKHELLPNSNTLT